MSVITIMHPAHQAPVPSAVASAVPAHKRILDLGIIMFALPVLLPVLIAIFLAVRFSSRGPVLFLQARIGKDGQTFRMVKFRSMYRDAEARRAALLATSERAGICFKQKDDPRVTPVGRFLRRSSLDELPQLWNVICGEMSLVGPRPALPEEVGLYTPEAMARLAGLPGLTGLWQVSGRADIGFEEMVAMDVRYLQTVDLRQDLSILLRTFGAVTSARGAY